MDQALHAIGSFFSTFQAKDWVTAVFAVAALVVSLLAITQRSRHLPKAIVVAQMHYRRPDDSSPYGTVVRVVKNLGNDTAYDMHEWLYHVEKPRVRLELDRGSQLSAGSEVESKSTPTANLRGERILLTWRQAPNMKRVQRKVLRVKWVPRDFVDVPIKERARERSRT